MEKTRVGRPRVGVWARANRRLPWLKVAGVFVVVAASVMAGVVYGWASRVVDGGVLDVWAGRDMSRLNPDIFSESEVRSSGDLTGGFLGTKMQVNLDITGLWGKKLVALTFDDGPSGETARLLDVLESKKARATFFLQGSKVGYYADTVARQAREGHQVASHTMRHKYLTKLSVRGIEAEVNEAAEAIRNVLGRGPTMVRPPYGAMNSRVRATIRQPIILWSVDPWDWNYKDAQVVRDKVVSAAFDGAIVILHDVYSTTVDAVGEIIDTLRGEGYEFVTVEELMAHRGQRLVGGQVYRRAEP